MSWETRDVLAADTADVLAADTRDVLAADTRDVLAADTTDVLAADITPCSWSCSTSDGPAAPVMLLQEEGQEGAGPKPTYPTTKVITSSV